MSTMSPRPRFAILVGVEDYSTFDASAARPPGSSNLRGGLNDVRVLRTLCLRLGYKPEDILVCSSPAIDPLELGLAPDTELVRTATRQDLIEAFGWIARRMTAHPGSTGLFAWSGHGCTLPDGDLGICPADVSFANGELRGALDFSTMEAKLPPGMGWWMDTCHAGAGTRSLTPSATVAPHRVRTGEHTCFLGSSGPDQPSYERKIGGKWYGAYSWALAHLLDQWPQMREEGAGIEAVTHEAVTRRARALLASMGIHQTPIYHGPPCRPFVGVARMHGDADVCGPSTLQIWTGDSTFTTYDATVNGVHKGWYVAAPAGCTIPPAYQGVFSPGNEYWVWQSSPAWPASFNLTWQSSTPTNLPTSGWTRLPLQPLPPGGSNYVDNGLWKVQVSGSATLYYMKRATSGGVTQQTWYGPSSQSSVYIGYGTHNTVVFTSVFSINGSYTKLVTTESV